MPAENAQPPDADLNASEPAHRAEELLPLVYSQLRAAAQAHLASERAGYTLQATALVHEAYLKLVGPREVPWRNGALLRRRGRGDAPCSRRPRAFARGVQTR